MTEQKKTGTFIFCLKKRGSGRSPGAKDEPTGAARIPQMHAVSNRLNYHDPVLKVVSTIDILNKRKY